MDVLKLINTGVNNLPTLPTVFSKLSEAIDDPNTNTEKIAKIISSDQSSAFKILKVANSPFFGFRGRIDTVSQAIFHLGFNEVRNIIFALSIINFFSKDKILAKFRPIDFWAHSIGVGIATRLLGSVCGVTDLEPYFLAGIFHDIGKLLFFEFAQHDYLKVLDLAEERKILIKDAEIEVLGIDHADAGKMLAERWKMPQNIQDTIRFHHAGIIDKETNILVASVHLGDILARALSLGFPGDNLIPQVNEKIWDTLKLPEGFIKLIKKDLQNDFGQMLRIMLMD
jgi:putative nucleotidyltransferase with HDIG domain